MERLSCGCRGFVAIGELQSYFRDCRARPHCIEKFAAVSLESSAAVSLESFVAGFAAFILNSFAAATREFVAAMESFTESGIN